MRKKRKTRQIKPFGDSAELDLYRGFSVSLNKKLVVRQPTLDEIADYGEQEFWNMIFVLTAVGADIKAQLWDMGIDYTKITDMELFCALLRRRFSKDETRILFGDFDFSSCELRFDARTAEPFLVSADGAKFDGFTYLALMKLLRTTYFLKRNDELPANESTKRILIEDAREALSRRTDEKKSSVLKNLVSFAVNSEGFKGNFASVWDMPIYPFLDAVRRLNHVKNADILLLSALSGFGCDPKRISRSKTDRMANI